VTMEEREFLAEQFEEHRARLRAVAYRMLGSLSEADDAVQEAWIRLSRTDANAVENLGGWLTTVVARVSLNMLRSRRTRREEPLVRLPEPIIDRADGVDPEHEALLADSVGLAMLVVLETLSPPERVAFVLHDIFGMPFEEIAPIVDRSPDAARQLASRARRRVQGEKTVPDVDLDTQRRVVDAFLAAAREGDFEGLLEVLDPDVVLRVDVGPEGESIEVRGHRWSQARRSRSRRSDCSSGRRSSTASQGLSRRSTESRSPSARSRFAAGRSSRSTSCPTRRG
jgi:RNA polymerase sigma-70 factor, ECF subfamily